MANPLTPPKLRPSSGPRAVVIGAGVSGLTTARCLQQRGFAVTVIADRFQSDTTSVVAGALWEWPPAVCGYYEMQPEQSLRAEQRWCVESYNCFKVLARQPGSGVSFRPVIFYLETPAEENPLELRKMCELREHVGGFLHSAELATRPGINATSTFVDAYTYETPLVDTDIYMAWLLGEVLGHGGAIVHGRVDAPLVASAPKLRDAYRADVIVNCAGLGARDLADDDVIPVRGAWLLVENDGQHFPKVTTAHCSSLTDSARGGGFLFIVPRGRDRLILGGIAHPDRWTTELGSERTSIVDSIRERCTQFMPCLANAEISEHSELRVGLRPFRRAGVRVECEAGIAVVHNYGHGGSGVTLSWGAAGEAALLASEAVLGTDRQSGRSLACAAIG
jgi:D-amino-acid oxidase